MEQKQKVNIKSIKIGAMKLKIKGISPYLPEPMDMQVLELYNKKRSKQNYTKDQISEEEKVKAKFYYDKDGDYAIPTRAFYNAMIRASSYLIDKKDGGMRNIKEGVTILNTFTKLKYEDIEILTHWGRTSGQNGSPRKIMRNAFNGWECEITIQYNKEQLSSDQIYNILNWGGFHIGVGGFRKEKTGNYGSFKVEPIETIKTI